MPTVRRDYKAVEHGISDAQAIEFEVAVTAQESSGSEAKLNVVAALVGGGVSGHSDKTHDHVSRLKFRIPIQLPNHEDSDET